jgi:alkylhydroperoxidase family enzyme
MLPFLEKLTVSPESMVQGDVAPLRSAGISESAIVDAIYVCMLFCTMNRMVDALGVAQMTPKQIDKASRMLFEKGYDM